MSVKPDPEVREAVRRIRQMTNEARARLGIQPTDYTQEPSCDTPSPSK